MYNTCIAKLNVNTIKDIHNLSVQDLEYITCYPDKDFNNYKQTCPECNSNKFIEDSSLGMILCFCGQMIDIIIDSSPEKRSYDVDQVSRCNVVHNRLLPQSSLSTTINTRGKLRKLHIWYSMPYKERSDNVMFKKIHDMCTSNNIAKKIEDDAKIMCKKNSETTHTDGVNKGKHIITRGYNRAGIVASCVFIACRRNGDSRSAKEIVSYYNANESECYHIDERDLHKGIKSLITILNDNDIIENIGTTQVSDFIVRKCDELRIRKIYAKCAITIAKNIDRLNIASNHTTFSLAAASILLMATINKLTTITKKKLSLVFGNLSTVTIGKTYNQIKNLKSILTDDDKVDKILIDVAEQKKKRIVTKEVWDKMKLFDIDVSKYTLANCQNDDTISCIDDFQTKFERMLNVVKSLLKQFQKEHIYNAYILANAIHQRFIDIEIFQANIEITFLIQI